MYFANSAHTPVPEIATLKLRSARAGVSKTSPVTQIDFPRSTTALHQYGPCDEFYYILEGEFTVWWGKDASKLDNFYTLKKGDCTHYPTGWKYKVGNTGDSPGKFLWYMTSPPGIQQRLDKSK